MSDPSSSFPIHLGESAQFACVRDFFRVADFNDTSLCRLLGMQDMSDLGRVAWDQLPFGNAQGQATEPKRSSTGGLDLLPVAEPAAHAGVAAAAAASSTSAAAKPCSPGLQWCIEVFIRGLKVEAESSRRVCGVEVFSALLALGLLRRSVKNQATVFCPVWVYPADGFVMVSDRRDDPETDAYTPPADVVFPAIYGGTLRFLRLLPPIPGGEALDLCGGSGIGALRLARRGRSAATADLTERSAFFAEFNARLNDLPVTSLCGDLYVPAAGKQFDLISAHPPFVPDTGAKMIYRDGGDTGEEVTRRIIEGLPASLRPGGLCVILCVARDTNDETFELRARQWLGVAAEYFDIVFGLEKILSVDEVVESMRRRSQVMSAAEAAQLRARLRALGTRQFAYGALFIQRFAEPVNDRPLRIRITPKAAAAEFQRLLAWRQHRRKPGFAQWLAGSRPRLAPELELTVRHLVQEGSLVPAEFVFSISNGVESALRPDAWIVPLLARLEGAQSVADVFAQARDELPAGFALDDFAGLVQGMIERGLLLSEPLAH